MVDRHSIEELKLLAAKARDILGSSTKSRAFETDTDGWGILILPLTSDVDLELWLDKFHNGKQHQYWIGLGSYKSSSILDFSERVGSEKTLDWSHINSRKRNKHYIKWGFDTIPNDVVFTEIYDAKKGYSSFVGKFLKYKPLHILANNIRDFARSVFDAAVIGEFVEGEGAQITRNHYERDPRARKACLAAHGYVCQVCGDLLANKYGDLAHEVIHVHHRQQMNRGVRVTDPVRDLVPVCPNCHVMLHIRTGKKPRSVEALQKLLKRRGKG